jgi:YD repeat-containing protein
MKHIRLVTEINGSMSRAARNFTMTEQRGWFLTLRHGCPQELTRFRYNPNGKLLTVTDMRKNQATTYTYDTMDGVSTRKEVLNRMANYQCGSTLHRQIKAIYPGAMITLAVSSSE